MAERRKGTPRRAEDQEILAMKERIAQAEQEAREARTRVKDAEERAVRMEAKYEELAAGLREHLVTCANSSGRMEVRQETMASEISTLKGSISTIEDRSFSIIVGVASASILGLLSVAMLVIQTFIK